MSLEACVCHKYLVIYNLDELFVFDFPRCIYGKSPLKHHFARVRKSAISLSIKTEVLALGRPLIEHRDAAMAVQWLVVKCRASGEIPVAFCITVSRGCVRLLNFPHSPRPPTRRRLVPVFVYSSCFQSLSAEI